MEEYLRVRSLLDGAYGRSLHSTDGSGFVKVWVSSEVRLCWRCWCWRWVRARDSWNGTHVYLE